MTEQIIDDYNYRMAKRDKLPEGQRKKYDRDNAAAYKKELKVFERGVINLQEHKKKGGQLSAGGEALLKHSAKASKTLSKILEGEKTGKAKIQPWSVEKKSAQKKSVQKKKVRFEK